MATTFDITFIWSECKLILHPPSCLSTLIMEGKLQILETNPKSEEIAHFCGIFLCIWGLLL